MCGIVGYFGNANAQEIIMNGLHKLEYRGYDSAGVALLKNDKFEVTKAVGRISNLSNLLKDNTTSNLGIGHTRWATHGVPNLINCHPHYSLSKRFIIVHNGVIENYQRLVAEYLDNEPFYSDTDTEIIAHLLELFASKMSVVDAIRKTISLLEGSYALIIIDSNNKNEIYIAKNKSPLVAGYTDGGVIVASDVMALVGYAETYAYVPDMAVGVLQKNKIDVMDVIGIPIKVFYMPLTIKAEEIGKGNYDHYMLKEIDEQPGVLRKIISTYFEGNEISINRDILYHLRTCDRIYIIGAGTSMHAGCIGRYLFEKIMQKPTEVCIASEFAYNEPWISNNPFFIIISQSGETADCRASLVNIKKKKYPILVITNANESTLAKEADYVIPILAGAEISVASTKAYTGQVTILSLLAYSQNKRVNLKHELTKIILAIEDVFNNKKEIIKRMVEKTLIKGNCFYLGRGIDYFACMESALKLKEISYIQTEAFPSGEMKHGTIALIEEGTPVIAIITQEKTNLSTRNNLKEALSRGAQTAIISMESVSEVEDNIIINDVLEELTPIVSVVVGQLVAYYCAVHKGTDVDHPKNLAKSVTVE